MSPDPSPRCALTRGPPISTHRVGVLTRPARVHVQIVHGGTLNRKTRLRPRRGSVRPFTRAWLYQHGQRFTRPYTASHGLIRNNPGGRPEKPRKAYKPSMLVCNSTRHKAIERHKAILSRPGPAAGHMIIRGRCAILGNKKGPPARS